MTDLPAPTTAYLEPEAKKLAEDTDPHPRIYELPPAPTTPRRSLPFVSNAVVDGNLVTGQNPGSAKETAHKVAALL